MQPGLKTLPLHRSSTEELLEEQKKYSKSQQERRTEIEMTENKTHFCAKGRRQKKKTSYSVTLSLLPLTPSPPRSKVTNLISDKVVF